MKIIYDKAEAIREKEKEYTQMLKENRRIRIHNAIVLAIAALFLAGAAYLLFFILPNTLPEYTPLDFLFFFVLVCLICFGVTYAIWDEVWCDDEWYSENVHYYLATDGKNVLDHELKSAWAGYKLWVTYEDQNHVVDTAILPRCLKCVTKTDVSETTVDLKNNTVYFAYKN